MSAREFSPPANRLKLLMLAPVVPFPPDAGLKVRVFNLAKELAGRHEVHLFCLGRDMTDPSAAAAIRDAGITLTVIKKPPVGLMEKVAVYLDRLVHGVPEPYILSWERTIFRELMAIDPAGFDAVIAEHLFMARYATRLNMVKVITEHNVEGDLAIQLAKALPPVTRWLRKAEAAWITHYEKRMLRFFSAVIAVSEPDRLALQAMSEAPVTTVGNGVDCARFTSAFEAPHPAELRLLFLGLLSYQPNEEAVEWFTRKVLPLIRTNFPEAVLTIAGAEPSARVLSLDNGDSVRVTGPVSDVLPSYRDSSLMVVPLLQGGGSRLKVLEAFAAGVPVVSTSKGAEGLLAEDGTHLLIADAAADFAAAVSRLLEDEELYMRLRRNARKLVESRYDWPILAADLETVLRGVVEDQGKLN